MKKIVLCVFVFSMLLQGCGDSAKKGEEYLQSGKSYYDQGNLIKARVELKNALQIDGKLADAYYYLALINEKNQEWKQMFANLVKVIELSPSNYDARLKLARLYLLSGELQKANNEVAYVLMRVPDSLDAMALKGAILLKQGDHTAALAEANRALVINPAHIDSVSLKAVIYMNQQDYTIAEAVLDKALGEVPNELSLHLLKLQVHSLSKNDVAIEQDYKTLIKNFPAENEFTYHLAAFYKEHGREAHALSVLNALIAQNTEKIKPKLALVDFLVATDPKNAEITLLELLEKYPEETDLHLRVANLYIQQKRLMEAKKPLTWVVEHKGQDKEGLAAKISLAKLSIQDGDYNGASVMINEVLAVDAKQYDALILKTRISLINGHYDEAIAELRGVLRDYSKSDEAMVLLAQAYLKKNSPELAEENFRKALDLNPGNFSAVMPVVSRMVQSKDIMRADEVLQNALKIQPDHAGALQALATIRLLEKDWLGAQKVAELISTKPMGEGFSNYLSGKISQGQGFNKQAIEKYKLALSQDPGLSDALKSMSVCYEALNQRKEMFAYLDEFIQNNSKNPYPVILKSQLFVLEKNWDKSLGILNEGILKWPEVPQFYVALAEIYKQKNDHEKEINTYKKGLEKLPDNISLSISLASAYETSEDYDNALQSYEAIIAKRPDIDFAVNNLVSLLLDYYPSKDNHERAVKLARRFENSATPYYLDTYGWALLHNGKIAEPVKIFEKVVLQMPDIAVFKYHLGFAYLKAGEKLKALDMLDAALVTGSKQPVFLEKDKVVTLIGEVKPTM
ncbi:hypothetical protein AU255_03885 [Methyloprofundus sedimenti]|uniref:Uncharacterized protein n=1 Tax=Methyloprofundus sedimenti TaxID=1420851 RepID=A0A1V8M6B9_9GAMM|nr:tetratricopeptide repeat protein [Methyloprofundus sedimenti]OQK17048.1 hypothetical protein AU255_03885 [Methyloprofundus sedimenti]